MEAAQTSGLERIIPLPHDLDWLCEICPWGVNGHTTRCTSPVSVVL